MQILSVHLFAYLTHFVGELILMYKKLIFNTFATIMRFPHSKVTEMTSYIHTGN